MLNTIIKQIASIFHILDNYSLPVIAAKLHFKKYHKHNVYFFLVCLMYSITSNSIASNKYSGTVVDAMAQLSPDVPFDLVLENYRLAGISKVLMYPSQSVENFEELVLKADGLIVPLDSAKKFSSKANQFLEITNLKGAVGLGEVIVQHHPMRGDYGFGHYEFEGFTTRLKTHPAVKAGLKRGYPIFLHLEVREYPDEYETVIEDLKWLLKENKEINFILASLGQFRGNVLKNLFQEHSNLFVSLGFTNGITKKGQANHIAKGGVGSQNWINMHKAGTWRPAWKELIELFPERFLLSFYNVFNPHYKKRMHKLNDFYMRNLGDLSPSNANLIACGNAKRLFDLDVSCN